MMQDTGKLEFLGPGATREQLLGAMAANHRSWFARAARVTGGEVRHENGAWWARTAGPSPDVTLAFPRLTRGTIAGALDRILDDCRRHPDIRSASCWALDDGRPRELGVRLAARGFEWGWQAHWMALDLTRLQTGFLTPPSLRVEMANGEAVLDVEGLPDYSRDSAERAQAAGAIGADRTWHFVAWLDGRPVGHTMIHLTGGRLGAAGVYNMGVLEDIRNQGIGKAVLVAACRHTQELGCGYALLNATPLGEPVYRRAGFESIGHGQTWWLHRPQLLAPPARAQIALVEAVGLGDVSALQRLRRRLEPGALDALLPCGLTPLGVAIRVRRMVSVQWLVENGATMDPISAWDLGWKEQMPRLLLERPELVHHRSGRIGLTPLHVAVERNDPELARVILAAAPDLSLQDTSWHSTPLGWATHLGHAEIAEMIEASR